MTAGQGALGGLLDAAAVRLGRRERRALLAAFAVLFVATRVALLAASFPDFVHEEEPQRARLANDLLEGLVQPLLHYQYLGINGGSIPFAFVEAPFFLLLGNSYLSLKLAAIAAAAAGNVLFLAFLRRLHGVGVALLAAPLLLFPPPNLLCNNVMEADNHNVYFFFAPLVWLLLARHLALAARAGPGARRLDLAGALRTAGLGLLGGLATYCYPAFAIVSVTALAAWCLMDRRLRPRPAALALFAAGFALGMVPQAIFATLAAGVHREFLLSSRFADRFGLGFLADNAWRLLRRDAFNAPGYFIDGLALSVPLLGAAFQAAMVAATVAYVGLARRERARLPALDPRRGLAVALPGVVLLSLAGYVLVIGDLDYVQMAKGFALPATEARGRAIAYRYFTLMFYAGIGMAAAVVTRLLRSPRRRLRRAAVATYAGFLLLGAAGFLWLVVSGTARGPADGFSRPGIWYDIPRLNFYKWTGRDLDRCVGIIQAVDERYHRLLFMGLGENIAAVERDLSRAVAIVRRLPARHQAALFAGIGSYVATDLGYRERFADLRDPRVRARARALVPARYRRAFDAGFREDSGSWSFRQRAVWDPRTRRHLWALYHRIKGPRYEPSYYRY